MRTSAKISVRVDGCTVRVVGKSRERHKQVRDGEHRQQNRVSGSEPRLTDKSKGPAITYVDEFLLTADEESADGLSALAGVRELYDWGPWEHGTFTQCGVQIVHSLWVGFSLSCVKYAEKLVLLDLPSSRRTQRGESLTAGE